MLTHRADDGLAQSLRTELKLRAVAPIPVRLRNLCVDRQTGVPSTLLLPISAFFSHR